MKKIVVLIKKIGLNTGTIDIIYTTKKNMFYRK